MTTPWDLLRGRPVAVALSSGFFGFFHHVGVLRALERAGIVPVAYAGTSAGAIVAAMAACGMTADAMEAAVTRVRRADFWDLRPRLRPPFSLLQGRRFASLLRGVLPCARFSKCAHPLTVAAYCLEDGRVHYMDRGDLVEAVYASCAVPYLFPPAVVDGRRYWDGGFAEKTPLVPLASAQAEVVIAVRLPHREQAPSRTGWFSGLPLLAHVPIDERRERERASLDHLRAQGKTVLTLDGDRVWLGPFSLHRGPEALRHGYEVAHRWLHAPIDGHSISS